MENNTWKWFEEYQKDCWFKDVVDAYEEEREEY